MNREQNNNKPGPWENKVLLRGTGGGKWAFAFKFFSESMGQTLLIAAFVLGFTIVFVPGKIYQMWTKAKKFSTENNIPDSREEKEEQDYFLYEKLNNQRMKELRDSTDIPKNILNKWKEDIK